jgi:hypothetical protein
LHTAKLPFRFHVGTAIPIQQAAMMKIVRSICMVNNTP